MRIRRLSMRFATLGLMLTLLLTGCASTRSRALPDLYNYSANTQEAVAKEMESRSCPVMSDVMMPDYMTVRDQMRYLQSQALTLRELVNAIQR